MFRSDMFNGHTLPMLLKKQLTVEHRDGWTFHYLINVKDTGILFVAFQMEVRGCIANYANARQATDMIIHFNHLSSY